jgi:hypothetical protein
VESALFFVNGQMHKRRLGCPAVVLSTPKVPSVYFQIGFVWPSGRPAMKAKAARAFVHAVCCPAEMRRRTDFVYIMRAEGLKIASKFLECV